MVEVVGALCLGIAIGILVVFFITRFDTFTPQAFGSVVAIIFGGVVLDFLGKGEAWWYYPIGLLAGIVGAQILETILPLGYRHASSEALTKRISELEKLAETYKKYWEELTDTFEKHKAALLQEKDKTINDLKRAIDDKDVQLKSFTEEKLRYIEFQEKLFNDSLTKALSRKWIHDILPLELEKAEQEGYFLAFLLIDVDRFKQINDSMGHEFSDKVLVDIKKRLTSITGDTASIVRIGGDEFLIISNKTSRKKAELLARNIISSISKPFSIDDRDCSITVSIGVSLYPNDGDNVEALLKKADIALYNSKKEGRNTYNLYMDS